MQHNITRLAIITAAIYGMCCLAAFGQTAGGAERETPAQRNQQPADAPQMMQRNNGSLLRAALQAEPDPGRATLHDVSFFAVPEPTPRTIQKRDLVTIIIREQSEFVSDGSTETRKQAAVQARIEEFLRLNLQALGRDGQTPAIDASGSRQFIGEGTVDRSDSFTARITVEVLDVKPNGNLVLQGRKRIRTDDEEQQFIITGICRAEDVTIDNTVLSTQLHEFDVQKLHHGTVRNATRKGLIPRLLDALNPF